MTKKLLPSQQAVTGYVRLLKVLPYKGCMVYIRMIGREYFGYDLIFKNELYSGYLLMKPRRGKHTLTEAEIAASREMIFAGAMSTIDALLGDKISAEQEEVVKIFETNRERIENAAGV